jgi:hypothetical protein
VSEQELRPLLDRMARLVDSKAWYIVEKGDIEVRGWGPILHTRGVCWCCGASRLCVCVCGGPQVVPLVLEAEQKEIESMQALMDAGA